ncbi:MAG TPA: hypothetical protein VK035_07450 [Kiloniellales bacterium]|nr:hypothetical protein [Kiloniellales bacterium]
MHIKRSRETLRTFASKSSLTARRGNARWRELGARGLLAGLVAIAIGLWIMMVL